MLCPSSPRWYASIARSPSMVLASGSRIITVMPPGALETIVALWHRLFSTQTQSPTLTPSAETVLTTGFFRDPPCYSRMTH